MAVKRIAKNISVDPDLLKMFDEAVKSNNQNRSKVLQECMRAYLELSASCRAITKRLPTLESSSNTPVLLGILKITETGAVLFRPILLNGCLF